MYNDIYLSLPDLSYVHSSLMLTMSSALTALYLHFEVFWNYEKAMTSISSFCKIIQNYEILYGEVRILAKSQEAENH